MFYHLLLPAACLFIYIFLQKRASCCLMPSSFLPDNGFQSAIILAHISNKVSADLLRPPLNYKIICYTMMP